jgi:hypothetical protein
LLAFPFLVDLATEMGLDVPAAALALAYLALGLVRRPPRLDRDRPGRRARVRRRVPAEGDGAAPRPRPILAGLVRRLPAERLLPASGGLLLAADRRDELVARDLRDELGTVYRLGTPAWTLVPLWLAAPRWRSAG